MQSSKLCTGIISGILAITFVCCSGDKIPISHFATGAGSAVASGDSVSTAIGLAILDNGGNAADAAAAVILSLTVTDSKDLCFGGEASVLLFDPATKEIRSISAIGRAPSSPAGIQWYMENGIPSNDIRSAPVPAIAGLLVTLLEKYGTMTFSEIARPTLLLMEENKEPWHHALSITLKKLAEAEDRFPGDRIKGLEAVNKRFYEGDIADSLASWYSRSGSFLTKADLANHRTMIDKPVCIDFHGCKIYKCGPWTQGPVLCEALNILDQKIANYPAMDLSQGNPELVHFVVESMKLAMADRDEYFGDPEFTPVPIDSLLSRKYAGIRSMLIDSGKASVMAMPGDPLNMKAVKKIQPFISLQGGTTTCCITDKNGMMIAATPSGWGSDAGPGGSTGIWHSTRLRSFNTTPGHPNCIQPGKRPRVTLTPTLILKDDQPFAAIAVAGGDVQDQVTFNLLINLILLKMDPNESVQSARYVTNLLQDSFNPSMERRAAIPAEILLTVSQEMPGDIVQSLESKGHHIARQDLIGEPVLISVDWTTGITTAVSDKKTNHFAGIVK